VITIPNVNQINIKKDMRVKDIILAMENSGVMGAGRLSKAAIISKEMISDKNCKVFMGLAGAMVPGGMKNIIIDMLENKYVDVFVVTGANLTHDLIEALGFHHGRGTHLVDDKKLHKQGVDRIYDSYMPNKAYESLEDFFEKHLPEIYGKELNIKEFLWWLGSKIPAATFKHGSNRSILRSCYEKQIPIFCPALQDSGIGLMIYNHIAKNKKIKIDAFSDMKEIMGIAWSCKKAGVIYIGGGVPKNYIQQAMQLSPKSASYGVQITMDRPEPGGSSGAELREGISWGKMNEKGKFVDLICDATIALPLILAYLKDEIKQ